MYAGQIAEVRAWRKRQTPPADTTMVTRYIADRWQLLDEDGRAHVLAKAMED